MTCGEYSGDSLASAGPVDCAADVSVISVEKRKLPVLDLERACFDSGSGFNIFSGTRL